MHDRTANPKPLVGELPELKGQGRDLRIDACRGIALWCIFLDHVPNNIGSWLTLRNYGFSDAAEVFMFVSGVTCALAYGKAWRCEGWTGSDQPDAAAKLGHLCRISAAHARLRHLGSPRRRRTVLLTRAIRAFCWTIRARRSRTRRSCNTVRSIPTCCRSSCFFISCSRRCCGCCCELPNVTLGASLALYALVHVFGWTVPAWPNGHWAFNPLAWQLLVVLGAWWMIEDKRVRPWVTSRTALVTCRPVSALQPGHRIELAHQTAGSTDPAGAGEAALPDWINQISIHCDCCIFWP